MNMRICDPHIHSSGRETAKEIEKAFDNANIEKGIVISYHPYLLKDVWHPISVEEFRSSIEHLSSIQKMLSGRVYGFAFVDPRMVSDSNELVKLVEWALVDKELSGVKMIPAGWYPYEEKLYPLYEKLEEINTPILFHCGISWGFPDSSRFCKPVLYEPLMRFKKLRFALAHICWPWIDEALAVGGRFLYPTKYGWISSPYGRPQIIFDISSGAPLQWKIDALFKAVTYLGAEMLMFASDCHIDAQCISSAINRDLSILKGILARSDEELEKIFRKNFEWFIKG
uniref:Amidohydrolase-related domain-containing protein n=1 Tax=Ignisphaera aggregans TaxID=334771 RepID=A0A7J3I8Z2_9CREN